MKTGFSFRWFSEGAGGEREKKPYGCWSLKKNILSVLYLTSDVDWAERDVAEDADGDVAPGAEVHGAADHVVHQGRGRLGEGLVDLENLKV